MEGYVQGVLRKELIIAHLKQLLWESLTDNFYQNFKQNAW